MTRGARTLALAVVDTGPIYVVEHFVSFLVMGVAATSTVYSYCRPRRDDQAELAWD